MKKRFLKKIILIVKLSLTIGYTFCISKLRILLIRFKTFVITLTITIVNQAKKKLINAWNSVLTYILTKITALIYQLKIKLTQIITYLYSYIKDILIKIFNIWKLKIIHTFTTSFIINKLAETIKNWHIRFNKFKNKISNTVPFKYKRWVKRALIKRFLRIQTSMIKRLYVTSNNTLIIKSLYPKINYGLFLSMVSKSPYLLYSFQDYMLLFSTTTEFINLEIFYSKLNYIKNYTFLKKVICYICIVYILSEVKVLKIKNIYRNYNKEIKHLTGTINLQMKFFQYSFSIDIILYLNRLYSGSLFIDITYVKLWCSKFIIIWLITKYTNTNCIILPFIFLKYLWQGFITCSDILIYCSPCFLMFLWISWKFNRSKQVVSVLEPLLIDLPNLLLKFLMLSLFIYLVLPIYLIYVYVLSLIFNIYKFTKESLTELNYTANEFLTELFHGAFFQSSNLDSLKEFKSYNAFRKKRPLYILKYIYFKKNFRWVYVFYCCCSLIIKYAFIDHYIYVLCFIQIIYWTSINRELPIFFKFQGYKIKYVNLCIEENPFATIPGITTVWSLHNGIPFAYNFYCYHNRYYYRINHSFNYFFNKAPLSNYISNFAWFSSILIPPIIF